MLEEENYKQSVFEEIPTEKIYSAKAINLAAFFAGSLAAGYLIAENFKAFNDTVKARNTLAVTFISTPILVGIVFIIPPNFPGIVFPALYILISYLVVKKHQEKKIQNHAQKGGDFYGGWRVTLIGLISIVLFLILPYSIQYIIDNFF
ncbi:hypothetical protein ACFFLS_25140 [Flavobacterium procerum]|uniref:Uncharacterized protein n=1 Tax=Flavobacterium procerum TaxID=1455569 RepID=A0ABV6BZ55_9FLAO